MEIFSNALCNDWMISKQHAFVAFDQLDQYMMDISADLSVLVNRDLTKNIYNTDLCVLLEQIGLS
jgi:hypothetical protein